MKKYPKLHCLWKREGEPYKAIVGEYLHPEFRAINLWHVTEKLDGTNIRVIWDGVSVSFMGRNSSSIIPEYLESALIKLFPVSKLLDVFGSNRVILYGEGIGPKIGPFGSRYSYTNYIFALFDICFIPCEGRCYWGSQEVVNDIANDLGIHRAPYIGIMSIDSIMSYMSKKPFSLLAEDVTLPIEGIVARSNPLMLYRFNHEPIMFKLRLHDL